MAVGLIRKASLQDSLGMPDMTVNASVDVAVHVSMPCKTSMVDSTQSSYSLGSYNAGRGSKAQISDTRPSPLQKIGFC